MRLLRVAVIVIFIFTSVLFSMFYTREKLTTDKTKPVITIEEEILDVDINATKEELLKMNKKLNRIKKKF